MPFLFQPRLKVLRVGYDITFKYDNSVNIKEHLQYLDEIEPKQ